MTAYFLQSHLLNPYTLRALAQKAFLPRFPADGSERVRDSSMTPCWDRVRFCVAQFKGDYENISGCTTEFVRSSAGAQKARAHFAQSAINEPPFN